MVLLIQCIGIFGLLICLDGISCRVFSVIQWILNREEVFEIFEVFEVDVSE